MELIIALLVVIGLPMYLASQRNTSVILWGIVGIVTACSHWLLWVIGILCLAMAPRKIKEVQ